MVTRDLDAGREGLSRERPSAEEIQARMRDRGFAELRWLWSRFRRSGISLASLDADEITALADRHMGAFSRPWILLALSLPACWFGYHDFLDNVRATAPPLTTDPIFAVLFAAVVPYLMWFTFMALHRTIIHSWSRIAAMDLAHMLSHEDFGTWLDGTEAATRVADTLQIHGVIGWDDPAYQARYRVVAGRVEASEERSSSEFVQGALRDVLGSKEDRKFKPGRYTDSLQDKKKSVTRFVKKHQEAITRNREGTLPLEQGRELLQALVSFTCH